MPFVERYQRLKSFFNANPRRVRILIFAICAFPILLGYKILVLNRAHFEMVMTTDVREGQFQIYWAGANESFSEERSRKFDIIPGKNQHYGMYLTDLSDIRQLRLDPLTSEGKAKIHYIIFRQEEIEPIRLVKDKFYDLVPVGDISLVSYNGDGITVESSGADPGLYWGIEPRVLFRSTSNEIFRVILFLALSWIVAVMLTRPSGLAPLWTRIALWVALVVIIVMTVTSKYNKHPDEYVHVRAGQYYENAWLKPKICEPGTEHTYSIYGVSRLNSKEIVYFLAGKIASLFAFLPMDSYLRLRLFNAMLFALILCMSLRNREMWVIFVPFLISPQIWYIYSYFDSDAFSLIFTFFICFQLVKSDSILRNYLSGNDPGGPVVLPRALLCGIMLGLAFFVKKNFIIVFVFLTGALLIEYLFSSRQISKWVKQRRAVNVTVIVLSTIFIVYLPILIINGPDSEKTLLDCREKLALYHYKPSTPLSEKWITLNLREKGLPLSYVLKDKNWGERMFRTAFGIYGYTSIVGTNFYYNFVKLMLLAFLAYISWAVWVRAGKKEKLLYIWLVCCGLFLLGVVLWRNWNYDLQVQGRYLFPVLPMMSVFLFKARKAIDKPMFHLISIVLFLTSLYSFVFVGLNKVPKI